MKQIQFLSKPSPGRCKSQSQIVPNCKELHVLNLIFLPLFCTVLGTGTISTWTVPTTPSPGSLCITWGPEQLWMAVHWGPSSPNVIDANYSLKEAEGKPMLSEELLESPETKEKLWLSGALPANEESCEKLIYKKNYFFCQNREHQKNVILSWRQDKCSTPSCSGCDRLGLTQ